MTRRVTIQIFFVLASVVATVGYALEGDDQAIEAPEPTAAPVLERRGVDPDELEGVGDGSVRLREGKRLVNRIGELRETGGRIAFYPDGETHSLQLLENLALERVSHDLDQQHRKWSVTGTVTEYRGGNYLLLDRAVLKARVSKSSGPRS